MYFRQETFNTMTISSASPVVKSFLAGSLSGTCSTLLFQPLDLIKTRVQQVNGIGSSTLDVTKEILGRKSLPGLWQGLYPSLVRTVPGVGIYFSCMHTMKTTLFHGAPSSNQSLFIGASSRAIAGCLMIPATVIKIRCESGKYGYKSIFGAVHSITVNEGLRGLSSGLLPTLVRDVPFSGIYLMLYETLKVEVDRARGGSSQVDKFACSLVAGALASIVTQPADVIKTRMQLGGSPCGAGSTLAAVVAGDGVAGLFRGCALRTLRRTLMASLAWTVYEQALRNFGLK